MRLRPPCTRLLVLAMTLGLAGAPAWAGSPASIPSHGGDRAQESFRGFAQEWMTRLQGATPGNVKSASYRGYDTDFRTDLRATGNPAAPYIGVLHYVEHVYRCTERKGGDCRIASSTPVVEIFRYRDGQWIY